MKKLLLLLLLTHCIYAQTLNYDSLATHFGKKHLPTLLEYIKLPCDANFKDDIMKNIDWVTHQYETRGFDIKKIESATLPVLLLEKKANNKDAKTILFYYHSDGQPVKKEEWNQADPFIPVLKQKNADNSWKEIPIEKLKGDLDMEWRIFGRASSDDKGPGVMLLAALDAIESKGISPNYNLKILVDFEEERGSVSLPALIDQYKKELTSDLLLIFDGPAHASNLPTITFGARGITALTLTTYGPTLSQHSGHYGNYAPNPALKMVQLLSSMKDHDGKVIIKGFYDGIVMDAKTKAKLKLIPDDLKAMNKRLGIQRADKVGESYQESLVYPSLNIRGLKSGEVGAQATTIIPDRAIAEIDIRTVKETKPEDLILKVKNHIVKQGYFLTENEPTLEERATHHLICKIVNRPAYGAFGTDLNSNVGIWLEKAMAKTTNKNIIKLPTMGGSVPISPFVVKLGVTAIIIPTVNSDNNQHAANENFRLGNYFDGIKSMIGILTENY